MSTFDASSLNVAIVHDWLVAAGGAERVLGRMLRLFPQARVFTLFGDASAIPIIPPGEHATPAEVLQARPRLATSWLQGLPGIRRFYRYLAPVMPWATETLRIRNVDLVISSSWAFAHGIKLPTNVPHLAYIHSPMRWAWDMRDDYLELSGLLKRPVLAGLARWQIERLRQWDCQAAMRPTRLVANSQFIQARIRSCWQREADCLYPPVSLPLSPSELKAVKPHGAFVTMSRLVPYKRVDAIVKAFTRLPQYQLVVAGDGPERARLQAMAPANVSFTGWVSEHQAKEILSGSRGFIQASKEDFGITAVEAQACGVPVLAYGEGGAREIVLAEQADDSNARGTPDAPISEPTGQWFDDLSPEALALAIERFSSQRFSVQACQANARRFSPEAFDRGLLRQVELVLTGRPAPSFSSS